MEQSTEDILKTTIRIDQNLKDPSAMITRIVDEGGIEAIRANSHRYVGVFDSTANLMSLRQLDDNDGTKYLDGTAAPITTLGNDVWMKLPQFYWKCNEYATDVWDFSVAYGGKPDDSYKEWDGKDLIGAYEAYASSSKLYSVSGKNSTGYVSQDNFKTYARNRGDGFTLVKWKHHCMIAVLFYAMYNHTDSRKKVGCGTSSYSKTTGQTNSLGMSDTVGGGNGDTMSINFWGLENWWGNKLEIIDNVVVSSRVFSVTEDDGTIRIAGTQFSVEGFITKIKFGEYIDLIPTSTGGSSSTGFCDYSYCGTDSNNIINRSHYNNQINCGVSYVHTKNTPSQSGAMHGTRLSYRGDYIITD